ncbi:MAG: hypothetical protein ACR2H6_02670, partial [Pyrinomonadaceae bacterium]
TKSEPGAIATGHLDCRLSISDWRLICKESITNRQLVTGNLQLDDPVAIAPGSDFVDLGGKRSVKPVMMMNTSVGAPSNV